MYKLTHKDSLGFVSDVLETHHRETALAWFNERASDGEVFISDAEGRIYRHNPRTKRLDLRGKTPMERLKRAPLENPAVTSVRIGAPEAQALVKFGGSLSGGINRVARLLIENFDTFETLLRESQRPD